MNAYIMTIKGTEFVFTTNHKRRVARDYEMMANVLSTHFAVDFPTELLRTKAVLVELDRVPCYYAGRSHWNFKEIGGTYQGDIVDSAYKENKWYNIAV